MKGSLILIICIVFSRSLSFAQDFSLESSEIKIGDVYVANPDVYFGFSNWTIESKCFNHLDSIAVFLIQNDSIVVEIGTHTDSRGSDKMSHRLDKRRSDSVVEYLIERGVLSDRLVSKGYGETQLIVSDEEIQKLKTELEVEEAHAVNRRTEFKVIEIRE